MSEIRIKTSKWPDVVEFYRKLVEDHQWDIAPLHELVQHIAGSQFGTGVHPATSHATLRLGTYPDYATGDGELLIDYDSESRQFSFNYFQSEYSKPWTRVCNADEGKQIFERVVVDRLQWFKKRTSA